MSQSESSGASSFASSDTGSSVASDNADSRALTSLSSGSADDDANELDSNKKTVQEVLFATLYTLTKNKQMDASVRLAVLKVVVEFLQMFRVLFNTSFPWKIQKDLWWVGTAAGMLNMIFVGIQWLLFRLLLVPKGYEAYIMVFYLLASLVLVSLLGTAWVAVALKGDDANNIWLKRFITTQQWAAMVMYTMFWPAILDYFAFMFDCTWSDWAQGNVPHHIAFPEQSCLAMPHLLHMLFAGFMAVVFGGMTLIMSTGMCDLNPLTKSILASADAATSFKLLGLKLMLVVFNACLDSFMGVQIVLMLLAIVGISTFLFYDLPYYNVYVNIIWNGLWGGLLLVVSLLTGLYFTSARHSDDPLYAEQLTWAVLYVIFPVVLIGAVTTWVRMGMLRRLSAHLQKAFEAHKTAAASANDDAGSKGHVLTCLSTDLKTVYRWKDTEQVSIILRDMRQFDEDGVPDPEAAEFGEFVLKCAMARMPNSPALRIMYANYLIEVRKDGQAARTQMQLAIKANPSLLDNYNIYVAQQLAKQLKQGEEGLDLLGYVEFQRNYRSCIRAHQLALMSQRQFWNSLLRDSVSFADLLDKVEAMDAAEQRAVTTYRRVLERYPNDGKVLRAYARFLEFVRNEPWTAAKYYQVANKQGTAESMLAMTAGQASSSGLAAAVGSINEQNDGLIVINAQGIILMANAAALSMFGYAKGEIEGKNVSLLMPPPFSTQHDGFLQRFVSTGIPHIANKRRDMVALHKDHFTFPIMLCATKLSGVGADMLFMGVVRRLLPTSNNERALVRFWTTASGLILCSDCSTADSFGMQPSSLLGRSFGSLFTQADQVNSFLSAASKATPQGESWDADQNKLQAQIVHSYLPPVDVELSITIGGASDDKDGCKMLCIQTCVLSESAATLVLDYKARIIYTTDKLASMLGYTVPALLKMDLGALLPQPYCQLYKPWLTTDLTKKASPSSCMGGGVVHILASNGAKVPVTLKISAQDNMATGAKTLVVLVSKATEDGWLSSRCLNLNVNHNGTILEVNSGAPKGLYGFDAAELVGRPLAAIIDTFGLWRREFGEDDSLLAILASQAIGEGSSDKDELASWRVGVHPPVSNDANIIANAEQLAGFKPRASKDGQSSSLLELLQAKDRLKPAHMRVEMLAYDEQLAQQLQDAAVVDTIPLLQVSLFRADALSGLVELDKHLAIAHVDGAIEWIFGVSKNQLLKLSFPRLVCLPTATTFEDLLGTSPGTKATQKGAIKGGRSGAAGASHVGLVRHVTGCHLSDGQPLSLAMQALSYTQGNKTRFTVQLHLHEPRSASMHALLQIKDGKPVTAALLQQQPVGPEHTANYLHRRSSSPDSNSSNSVDEDGKAEHTSVKRLGTGTLFNRTRDWVRQASQLSTDQKPTDLGQQHLKHSKYEGYAADVSAVDEDEHAAVAGCSGVVRQKGYRTVHSGATEDRRLLAEGQSYNDTFFPHLQEENVAVTDPACVWSGSMAEAASACNSASIGDGCSEADASEMSATRSCQEEELAIDARRAKRLRKLSRILNSSAAQLTTSTWRKRTLYLLGIVAAAHMVFFASLVTEIDRRYANAQAVAGIAQLLFYSQQVTARAYFLQRCYVPEFSVFQICSDSSITTYHSKLLEYAERQLEIHHQLFLGTGSQKGFQDVRLMQYWAHKHLSERSLLPYTQNGSMVLMNGSRTLWEIGNSYVAAAKTVYFYTPQWKESMENASSWRYLFENGPESLYAGYAWSLDTFVDYTWRDLTTISILVIVLLVAEAFVVQLGCIAYQFYLLQCCNVSHMRMFSVFLALPSATVRLMAQRQLQIDDDSKQVIDDDDLELADGAAAATAGNTTIQMDERNGPADKNATAEKKQKSVHLAVEVEDAGESDKDDNDPSTPAKPASGVRLSGGHKPKMSVPTREKAATKKPQLGSASRKHYLYKMFFGWLDPKFKRNGKKLEANTSILWWLMIPWMLWMAAVIIIFGVSYEKLRGLQGPLASLDMAAHVMYRLTRARIYATFLAFSTEAADNDHYRAELVHRLSLLQEEYQTLLYGGTIMLAGGVNVSFNPAAPASVFNNPQVADLFFKTTNCLRVDQTSCHKPGSQYYAVTHSGIDAMMNKYIDNVRVFAALPDELAFGNHSTFIWTTQVAATDMVDGLNRANDVFVQSTISRLASVKQLHMLLLAVTLVAMFLYVLKMYVPYMRRLRRDSKAVAGLLSQVPAEVDVEGQVKAVVLGIVKNSDAGTVSGMDNTRRAAAQPMH